MIIVSYNCIIAQLMAVVRAQQITIDQWSTSENHRPISVTSTYCCIREGQSI